MGLGKTNYNFPHIKKSHLLLIYHKKTFTTIEMFTRKITHMQKKSSIKSPKLLKASSMGIQPHYLRWYNRWFNLITYGYITTPQIVTGSQCLELLRYTYSVQKCCVVQCLEMLRYTVFRSVALYSVQRCCVVFFFKSVQIHMNMWNQVNKKN